MKLVVFAHRGASGYAPDNTLQAFNLALQHGTKAIESDVKLTLDRKLVFFHDSAIKITGKFSFPLFLLPFSLVSSQSLGGNQRVARVEEIFNYYAKKGVLEDLAWSLDIPGMNCFKALKRACDGFGNANTIQACHTHYRFFTRWKTLMPEATLVWSIRKKMIKKLGLGTVLRICKDKRVDVINLKCADVTWEVVDAVRAASLKLYIWDVHDGKRFEIAMKFKPDAIYSNYPDKALDGGHW
ncbi:MAG: glycerophosphodiester phosphodiesterase [Promethearchaeota archaeon]